VVVESIWVKVQTIDRYHFVGHAQIYLRSGTRRYTEATPVFPVRCS
jgi:hypothetical protein